MLAVALLVAHKCAIDFGTRREIDDDRGGGGGKLLRFDYIAQRYHRAHSRHIRYSAATACELFYST